MNQLKEALHKIKFAQLKHEIEKRAGIWNHFKQGLMAAGTAAGVAGAGLAVQQGFGALKQHIEKPRAFKGMLGAAPGLKKMDQKAVQLTFNSLYAMNPDMAKDPLIAGSFVERHVGQAEGMSSGAFIDPRTAEMIQKSRGKETESPIMRAFVTSGTSAISDARKPPLSPFRPETSEKEFGREARMEEFKSKLKSRGRGDRYPRRPEY